jgi:PAS domain S-box-containing protein
VQRLALAKQYRRSLRLSIVKFRLNGSRAAALWQRLAVTTAYPVGSAQQQKSMLLASLLLFNLLVIVPLSLLLIPPGVAAESRLEVRAAGAVIMAGLYLLNRRGFYAAACRLYIAHGVVVMFLLTALEHDFYRALAMYYWIGLTLIGAVLLPVIEAALLLALEIGLLALLWPGTNLTSTEVLLGPLLFNLILGLMLIVIVYYLRYLERQRRRQLAHSEALYRALVDNFPGGMVALFDQDLRFIKVGGRGIEQAGLHENDLVGKRLRDRFPPEIYERDEPALRAALAGETRTAEVPYGGRLYQVTTAPARLIYGQPAGVVMAQDITDRKREEEQRLKLAIEHERIGTIKHFIHAMSHDFRNTLAMIDNARYFIERDCAALPALAPAPVQPRLDSIHTHVVHLTEQLDNLNMITSLDSLDTAACDLNALIDGVVRENTPRAAARQQQMTFTPAPQRLVISADAPLLRYAVRHLLLNAVSYTPEGGQITVITEQPAGHDHIEITVSDSGIGIAPEDQSRIFDLFYRADPARALSSGGVGLGLSIVRMIVEAHDGSIRLQSAPGAGSHFTLSLPISAAPASTPTVPDAGPNTGSSERLMT